MDSIKITDLGIIEYSAAWDKQRELFDALLAAKGRAEAEERLLLCEHPHVYTLGKSGAESNLLVDDKFLQSVGATYFKSDRGGDITYHGYGQIVGYPILDLDRHSLGLKDYIQLLEESVIRTIADYGIKGERLENATGVWIDTQTTSARKICAIGVKSSRYVTMHGFALNVNTDLRYFSYINPCGFVDKGVTSIAKEIGEKVDFEQVKRAYSAHFKDVFNK